jgi:hypothetical protein
VALYYGTENWIIKEERCTKTGSCTNEIPEIIIRPYEIGRERNPDIHNRLKVNDLIEDIK